MKAICEILKPLMNLSNEELENLRMDLNEELAKINNVKVNICYEHDCKDCSKYHLKKYNHWVKLVKAVDTTKCNGNAFIWSFLPVDSQTVIPCNSIVVERCHNRLRSYKITEKGKELVCEGDVSSMVTFINTVNKTLFEGGYNMELDRARLDLKLKIFYEEEL